MHQQKFVVQGVQLKLLNVHDASKLCSIRQYAAMIMKNLEAEVTQHFDAIQSSKHRRKWFMTILFSSCRHIWVNLRRPCSTTMLKTFDAQESCVTRPVGPQNHSVVLHPDLTWISSMPVGYRSPSVTEGLCSLPSSLFHAFKEALLTADSIFINILSHDMILILYHLFII